MSVKIRLLRVGKKKQPYYRVVVADARSPRDGRIIDRIGRYAPLDDPSSIEIDSEKAVDWLSKGAQPTEAVQKLLETSGVWAQFTSTRPSAGTAAQKKIAAHTTAAANRPAPEPEPEPAAPEPAAPAAETPSAADEPAASDESAAEAPTTEAPEAAEPATTEAPAADEPAADEASTDEPAAADEASTDEASTGEESA